MIDSNEAAHRSDVFRHITASGAIMALALAMPSIQVKDVPDELLAELHRRAAFAGKSLQKYLLARLIDEASQPTVEELLDRISQRSGGHISFGFATEAIRKERDAC